MRKTESIPIPASKTRILVSDDTVGPNSHGEEVKRAVQVGYNTTMSKFRFPDINIMDQIEVKPNWLGGVQYCKDNENIEVLLRSYTSVRPQTVTEIIPLYPRVQTFWPLGSNVFAQLNKFPEKYPPLIVIAGAGDLEYRNNTAFGNGIEFWNQDFTWDLHNGDQSSFSNGMIAGIILRIKDELAKKWKREVSWWEARYIARMTTWRSEVNRDNDPDIPGWCFHNGFGHPIIDYAIWQSDWIKIIKDPYAELIELGNVGKLTGSSGMFVKLKPEPIRNAELYVINRNGEYLTKITLKQRLEAIDLLTVAGTYKYTYYAMKGTKRTKESNIITARYSPTPTPKKKDK